MEDEQIKAEQKRVDRVVGWISEQIDTLREQTGEVRTDIVGIRRDFWDDVTVNFEDAAEAAETAASLKQQAEVLIEREHAHGRAERQLKLLLKLQQSPYFGRVDFTQETNGVGAGQDEPESIYLGVGSLLDESGTNYLIYDWRAPVSSLYYDYSPGPAKYDTPTGEIEGEMTLKRQYVIRRGHISGMFDTGVTIGDELLQEVLGKQSDAQMKSIVATIQHEQNLIIRNERAKLLVVQGAAGSGKTSAALQRIAYLLYRYRETLTADQVVLFSPNPMFNSYVSTVLPELGEQNMQQTTYQQYLEHRLGQSFALEDPFAQMEYTLGAIGQPQYETRLAAIRYKSGVSFMSLITRYAAALSESGLRFKAIKFRGRILISAEAMQERFYSLNRSLSLPNRIRMLAEWLLKELTDLSRKERKKQWVEDEMELLDNEAYMHAFDELRRKEQLTSDSFGDLDREKDLLAATIVQERFKRLRSRVKKLKFIDMPSSYRELFADQTKASSLLDGEESSIPEAWEQICGLTLEQLAAGVLHYEDATPYLYLKDLIEGFQTNTSVHHLFIDEAQDYSPFQFHYLKRIFPRAKMTVLGDVNQSIFAHATGGNGFQPLSELFTDAETEKIVLKRSYRSTREIIDFTSLMIEDGEQIIPFNRHGEKPAITVVRDKNEHIRLIGEKISAFRKDGAQSIAVIAKTAEESGEAYEALKASNPEIRLIAKETVTFEQGTVVIPSYLAKGVEFDAVIIFDAANDVYSQESERRLFYTACTRAMHDLHIFSTGEPTRFLDRALPSLTL
ncbi:RNA polymerase recycling motor HelD [Paenibacillus radicis (ex Gao et al. 2016)]|uniref:DNA helicase n=1 Tax=Paenibacillus radicis (ex Gao et al. 2016) TaxID=1737354 RepID=A0A917GSZ1_9BACL|nr:RNA polymerase recycling motor HelD [Paenibacillus radicis (ex Gao et al. 2016)]GGG56498.1 DNA helicase [Paenibacillus radicis (ex Gao et al. 2016)]